VVVLITIEGTQNPDPRHADARQVREGARTMTERPIHGPTKIRTSDHRSGHRRPHGRSGGRLRRRDAKRDGTSAADRPLARHLPRRLGPTRP
jgi:hypothetical protein